MISISDPQALPFLFPQRCRFFPGLPSSTLSSLYFRVCISDILRKEHGQAGFPIGLDVWELSDFRAGAGCVYAAPLCSFALKCVQLLHGWPVRGSLAVSRIKPWTLYLIAWGLLVSSCVLPVAFRPGPWSLFTEHCLHAKQEPSLWGSVGHRDLVTDFGIKLTWVWVPAPSLNY